eukprot:3898596-Pyramimonas_sp.AAC.1
MFSSSKVHRSESKSAILSENAALKSSTTLPQDSACKSGLSFRSRVVFSTSRRMQQRSRKWCDARAASL